MAVPGSHTYFFMHVMKTAGTSFAQHIQKCFGPDEVYPFIDGIDQTASYLDYTRYPSVDEDVRAHLRIVIGHFPYIAADLIGADVNLTLLRAPIDRLISQLAHTQRHMAPDMTLEEIYQYDGANPLTGDPQPDLFKNFQARLFARTTECGPLPTVDEAAFQRAVSNLESMTVVGLTESYQQFLDELTARFGWPSAPPVRLQVAPEPVSIDPSFRRRLERENEADLEFYRLACDLVSRRLSARV